MLMLLQVFGSQYVVWDKSAGIRFRKPGQTTLYMRYELTNDMLGDIRRDVTANGQIKWTFTLQWVDKDGVVHAEIERLCYIADKQVYQQKKGNTQQSRFQR